MVFLLALLGCGGGMPIQVVPGMKVVFVGDSITAGEWYASLVTQLEAAIKSTYVSIPPITAHPTATVNTNTRTLAVTNSGVGGDEISNIEADIPGRITDYNPDVVVIEVGVNDCVISQTPLAEFRASYDNVLATVKATLPNVQIVCISILCYRELWSATPTAHFEGNQFDTGTLSIPNYNAQIQASALAHGAQYIDVRTPAGLAEATLNAPAPGAISGGVTGDGIHPNDDGETLMSNAARSAFYLQ